MQNAASFMHNVGVYEWPNESGLRVLVSDGDRNGQPLKKDMWMIYIIKDRRWESFNVYEPMINDLGLETVIKTMIGTI